MRTNFKSVWVRKLIGKLGVPYNRRLRVRGSPHPLFYDADLSLPAADSNAFRIHLDLREKFENFEAAVALNFAYYNFCKTHKALRMTPAQAAGIESSAWTVEELVKRCGEYRLH
jgi:hypothetical protein